jgi:hypothetical protein
LEVRTNNTTNQGIKLWGYSADGSKNSNIYFGDNNGTNSYVMRFVNVFGGGTGELYGLNLRSLNTSADFNVMAGTEASPITGLTLKGNTGYVGLGTTAPYAPLTIGSGSGGGNVPATSKLVFGTNNSVVTFLSANDSASIDGVIGAWNTVYNHQNSKIVFDKNGANIGQLLFYTQDGSGIAERMRITSDGSVAITQTPGKYTIDTSGGGTSIGNGGTVDFPSSSGMLVVNNWSNGHVTIFLCGGGGTAAIGSVGATVGSFAYNGGIGGYTWTNNYGSTSTFGFFFVRTRPYA